MTHEEAIEITKNFCKGCDVKYFADDSPKKTYCNVCRAKDCNELIIGALEKQIPKKPGVVDGMRYCKICNTQTTKRILMGWEKCCPDCGQRIDWRQE